jgi:hypothetical protein
MERFEASDLSVRQVSGTVSLASAKTACSVVTPLPALRDRSAVWSAEYCWATLLLVTLKCQSSGSSTSGSTANVHANAAKEVIAFRRRRCPNRLEVGRRAPGELDVGVHTTADRVDVKMEEGLMSQVEVWAVAVTTSNVLKPVDCAERFDELSMSRPTVIGTDGLAFW